MCLFNSFMPIAPFEIYSLAFKVNQMQNYMNSANFNHLHLLFDIWNLYFCLNILTAIFSNMAVYLNIFYFRL